MRNARLASYSMCIGVPLTSWYWPTTGHRWKFRCIECIWIHSFNEIFRLIIFSLIIQFFCLNLAYILTSKIKHLAFSQHWSVQTLLMLIYFFLYQRIFNTWLIYLFWPYPLRLQRLKTSCWCITSEYIKAF